MLSRPLALLGISISYKLIIPFAIAVVAISAYLGGTCCSLISDSLNKGLLKKSKISCNNLLGVLADPFSMGEWTRVQDVINTAKATDTDVKNILLVADDGQVLASTDAKVKTGTTVSKQFVDGVREFQYTVRPIPGSQMFEVIAPISAEAGQRAYLQMMISRSDLNTAIMTTQSRVMVIALFGLLAGIPFYMLMIHGVILSPIKRVAGVSQRLAKGELVGDVEVCNNDEIGDLSHSMTELVHYLVQMSHVAEEIAGGNLQVRVNARSEMDVFGNAFRRMVESLQEITTKLSLCAQSLEQTASALAVSSTEQTHIVTQQHEAVLEWVSTLNEMVKSVTNTKNTAGSVLEISQQSLAVSKEGIAVLDETRNSMMKIRQYVGQINQNIGELANNAVQIGDITNLVDEIAEMSEILTINGGIEAVRAGEAGRGFHVIANEIKNLSMQSRSATARVRRVLGLIEGSTASVFKVVDSGNECVRTGVNQIQEVVSRFDTLYKTIMKALDAARDIAGATNSQVDQIQQITRAMKNIVQSSSESATAAQLNNATAQDLRDLAVTISGIVQHYRLGDDPEFGGGPYNGAPPVYTGAVDSMANSL